MKLKNTAVVVLGLFTVLPSCRIKNATSDASEVAFSNPFASKKRPPYESIDFGDLSKTWFELIAERKKEVPLSQRWMEAMLNHFHISWQQVSSISSQYFQIHEGPTTKDTEVTNKSLEYLFKAFEAREENTPIPEPHHNKKEVVIALEALIATSIMINNTPDNLEERWRIISLSAPFRERSRFRLLDLHRGSYSNWLAQNKKTHENYPSLNDMGCTLIAFLKALDPTFELGYQCLLGEPTYKSGVQKL